MIGIFVQIRMIHKQIQSCDLTRCAGIVEFLRELSAWLRALLLSGPREGLESCGAVELWRVATAAHFGSFRPVIGLQLQLRGYTETVCKMRPHTAQTSPPPREFNSNFFSSSFPRVFPRLMQFCCKNRAFNEIITHSRMHKQPEWKGLESNLD